MEGDAHQDRAGGGNGNGVFDLPGCRVDDVDAVEVSWVGVVGDEIAAGRVQERTLRPALAPVRWSGALTWPHPTTSPEGARMGRVAERAMCALLASVAIR